MAHFVYFGDAFAGIFLCSFFPLLFTMFTLGRSHLRGKIIKLKLTITRSFIIIITYNAMAMGRWGKNTNHNSNTLQHTRTTRGKFKFSFLERCEIVGRRY